jgi:hypothetical protein
MVMSFKAMTTRTCKHAFYRFGQTETIEQNRLRSLAWFEQPPAVLQH